MKKLYKIIAIIFCCLFFFPVTAEAKTMELNKEYTAKVDCDDWDDVSYTLKITEAGKYKVTISFDECYKSYYNDTPIYDNDVKARFVVHSGNREYKCEVPFGEEKSFTIGLDKGKVYIDSNDHNGKKYKISTIKVEKVSTMKYSFSQAYQFVKKNKNSNMTLKKSNDIIRISEQGFIDTSVHERDGYSMGISVVPYMEIIKQGKSTYATYNLFSTMSVYSIPYVDDSNLEEIVIYNKNDKIVYKLDSCKETNKYDYVDYIYKDECICESILFTSYVNSASDVNKLINVIKGDDLKIKIRGDATFTIKPDNKAKKQLLDSLRLYKELLKQYK